MKHFSEIALFFFLCADIAGATGIGGGSSGGAGRSVIVYDSQSNMLCIPGRLEEHVEISSLVVEFEANKASYTMSASDFALLHKAQDTLQVIDATTDSGAIKSYRIISGDEIDQLELIDRRAAIRGK